MLQHNDLNKDMPVIDWNEAILCDSKGFSRLVRHCDEKSLHVMLNSTLLSTKQQNHNIVCTHNAFVELTGIKETKNDGSYNFETKRVTHTNKCNDGFPDSLFLSQIYNEEKYKSSCNLNNKNSNSDISSKTYDQIFTARGMITTSLQTKKVVDDRYYWSLHRRCDSIFDFSTHRPGDYKYVLINSKLFCIISWDSTILNQFYLSFRRLHGGYVRNYTSHLVVLSANFNALNNNSNVKINIAQYGVSLDNQDVFGVEPSLINLSSMIFDCLLLNSTREYGHDHDCGSISTSHDNNNIKVTLLLICKAMPDMKNSFEFVKLELTFSDRYKNLLSCICKRVTDGIALGHLNIQTVLGDVKSECPFGWNN